jgi:phospholipid/cholesterol/gamma-HCH transport system substrate-binding protein
MENRTEQTLVGVFVVVASLLLLGTIFAITGTFGHKGIRHLSYFKNAGGVQAGATVRYGGMKAGRVDAVRVDPHDSTRIEIDFNVRRRIPVKTDSVAKITSLGALGDNYLELTTGTANAPLLPPNAEVKSQEAFSYTDLSDTLGKMAPVAQQLLIKLNQRVDDLQITLVRVNDLLNDRNRAQISSTLANLNGMLEEDRPKLTATLSNVQAASARMGPLLDDLKKSMQGADQALAHLDSVVTENREDLRKSMAELRHMLSGASLLVDQLDRTMDYNAENIDEILENVRMTTENLKQLTANVRSRPYTLIRGVSIKERKPGRD